MTEPRTPAGRHGLARESPLLEPVDLSGHPPEDADDPALVRALGDQIRTRIQLELDDLRSPRRSGWFG